MSGILAKERVLRKGSTGFFFMGTFLFLLSGMVAAESKVEPLNNCKKDKKCEERILEVRKAMAVKIIKSLAGTVMKTPKCSNLIEKEIPDLIKTESMNLCRDAENEDNIVREKLAAEGKLGFLRDCKDKLCEDLILKWRSTTVKKVIQNQAGDAVKCVGALRKEIDELRQAEAMSLCNSACADYRVEHNIPYTTNRCDVGRFPQGDTGMPVLKYQNLPFL